MKKIIYLFVALMVVLFTSCEDETSKGVSKVTTYADLTLTGDAAIFWPLNEAFVDPGFTAKEGENDITDQVTATSVDVSKGGRQTITYTVENSDGFSVSASRTVYVYEPSAALNGYYKSSITRSYTSVATRGPFDILIFGVGNGNYWVEDLLGGWYYIGSAYGLTYAGAGVIKLNADNTFSLVSSQKLAWGYPCLFTAPGTYDPATKTIVLNTRMEDVATMLFKVTLSSPTAL